MPETEENLELRRTQIIVEQKSTMDKNYLYALWLQITTEVVLHVAVKESNVWH